MAAVRSKRLEAVDRGLAHERLELGIAARRERPADELALLTAAGLIGALRHDLCVKSEIWLVRHGPTEWSEAGRHTSRTDLPLTDAGRARGIALAPLLGGPRIRPDAREPGLAHAWRPRNLAGFERLEVAPDLREWDYGDVEGLTTAEVRRPRSGMGALDGMGGAVTRRRDTRRRRHGARRASLPAPTRRPATRCSSVTATSFGFWPRSHWISDQVPARGWHCTRQACPYSDMNTSGASCACGTSARGRLRRRGREHESLTAWSPSIRSAT